jgi:hypothetical protein
MMNIFAYKAGIGWALSVIAATATVVIFQMVFGLSWLISVPAAVLAYVTVTTLWARYLNSIEHPEPPRGRGD